MKIGVLGDSHREFNNLHLAMNKLRNVDLIIHTGDHYNDTKYLEKKYKINTIGVKGNCDFFGVNEVIQEIEGKRFFICHGHAYGVKNNINGIFYRGREVNADVVVFGHTHIPFYIVEEGMVLLNPGSVTFPRGGSRKSCAVLSIEEDVKVEFLSIDS